jgi:uncharacterized protein YecA (UPF0149 family)
MVVQRTLRLARAAKGVDSWEQERLTRVRASAIRVKQSAAQALAPALPHPVVQRPLAVKVGRNDPCPYGGGAKFKQCCARRSA